MPRGPKGERRPADVIGNAVQGQALSIRLTLFGWYSRPDGA